MAQVVLENVNKLYDNGFHAVKDLNLQIHDKEFCVLVGPSGCGKTTTLRMVAGLEDVTSGDIYIGDRVVNNVKPKDRDIAMVFQSYALYPHMSVYDNMAFALKMRKMDKKEIDERVKEAAKILNIETQLDKKPRQLSGGQRQRVALGRAIVRKPAVFLMDEPLSNLDAKLRVKMRIELKRIHREIGATTIYVTHDQMEAMTLADKMAVMNAGVLQQFAHPMNAYTKPANTFVATFVGSPSMNMIEGTLTEVASGQAQAAAGGKEGKAERNRQELVFDAGEFGFRLEGGIKELAAERLQTGKSYTFGIRPEDVKVFREKAPNRVKGTVFGVELLGNSVLSYVLAGKSEIIAQTTPEMKLRLDEEVYLDFSSQNAHFFDPDVRVEDGKVEIHGKAYF
ncbi:MAG: sn-glycerol-3-phosphate ABC transporter ATP-binding protein UgpC [Thermoplasmata archaeon]